MALGIPLQKSPTDFDEALLGAVVNVDDPAAVEKLLPLDRDALERVYQFADTNFVRLANRLSATELQELSDYLAVAAEVPSNLAADLASGTVTVAGLLNQEAAPSESTESTGATLESLSIPAILAPVWQFLYANSIVVAAIALLCVVLLVGLVSSVGQRKSRHKTKRKRKPRDVYDIFGDQGINQTQLVWVHGTVQTLLKIPGLF